MNKLWIARAVVAAVVAAGVTGCSDSGKNADPKPVNVKDDPRIKRATLGGQEKTPGQLPQKK